MLRTAKDISRVYDEQTGGRTGILDGQKQMNSIQADSSKTNRSPRYDTT